MTHDAKFELNFTNAQADVRSMKDEQEAIGQFYQAVVDGLRPETLKKHSIHLQIDGYSLSVMDASSGNEIGRIRFDVLEQQCRYSDFRGIPNYPLPPNWRSIPVAIGYMGTSVAYFRAMQDDDTLEFLGTSITEKRTFYTPLDE